MPQATMGTTMAPAALPRDTDDKARARFFSNQWISTTFIGKWPPKLEPSAITRNARYSCGSESIWLSSMKPTPKNTTPRRIMRCGPKRSISQPRMGPRNAASSGCMVAAPDNAVLLQPFSSDSMAKYEPND